VAQLPAGWTALSDDTLLSAVSRMGEPESLPLAATKAFEAFLAQKARAWGAQQAARLSVEFVVAFGRELTARLDINFRTRSSKLSDTDLATLTSPPFSSFVDHSVLQTFQDVPKLASLTPLLTMAPSAPPALVAKPVVASTPVAPSPSPSMTAPDSPRPVPLPPLPAHAAPSTPSTAQLLFTKA
jgi:hypothetical protein